MSDEKKMRVDFGCGPNKKDGFTGVDITSFDGKVDIVADITAVNFWEANFEANSIDEAHASHFIEHLTAVERCAFFNGLWRSLKPGAQATIITPHWASSRAYGDPTHQWPPISEFFWHYLDKDWRAGNAPHTDKSNWRPGYDCDFTATFGYAPHPALAGRNQEFMAFAMSFYKEAALDLHATITARKA